MWGQYRFSPHALLSQRREKLLFVYDLDLLVEHFPGKPVDRYMHPIMLFPFRDEIILEALSIWLIVTRLGHHGDQYVPDTCLRDGSHRPRNNFPSSLTVYLGALPPVTGRPTKIRYSGGAPNLTVTWLEQSCVPASHTL